MWTGWRRGLSLGLFVSATAAIAAFNTADGSESRLWVLTSSRLLELDLESGELVHETRAPADARLLDAGESLPPVLASPGRTEVLDADRASALRLATRDLPPGEKVLAAAQAAGSRAVLLASSTGVVAYNERGALARGIAFPFPVEVVAFGSNYLWGLGSRGGFRLDRADLGAAPLQVDIPGLVSRAPRATTSLPSASCSPRPRGSTGSIATVMQSP